jgi:hypothetical protein
MTKVWQARELLHVVRESTRGERYKLVVFFTTARQTQVLLTLFILRILFLLRIILYYAHYFYNAYYFYYGYFFWHVSSIFFLLPPMHSVFCCTAFF